MNLPRTQHGLPVERPTELQNLQRMKRGFSSHFCRLLLGLFLWKSLFFGSAILLIHIGPEFNLSTFRAVASWPMDKNPNWQTPYATWDGAHYLSLSTGGYERHSPLCAFYPLWPFLIRIGAFFFAGDHFWSGMILANVFSLAAMVIFFRFVYEVNGIEVAQKSIVLLLAFPGAIFLSLIYTEALFLFLSLTYFMLLFRQKYLLAACIAFFLPLTKAVGFFSVLPLAWRLYSDQKPLSYYMLLFGPGLGYLCYFLTMYLWTGNPFEGFDAQMQFPTQPSVAKIFDIPAFFRRLLSVDDFHSPTGSLLDRVFFLLSLMLLPFVFRESTALGLYASCIAIIPATSTHLISYTRNVMICFPLFIILAQLSKSKTGTYIFWCAVAVFGGLQVYLLSRYLSFIWAG